MDAFLDNYTRQLLSMREHPAKPVINSLTMIAEQNLAPQTADAIVRLMESNMREVNQQQRARPVKLKLKEHLCHMGVLVVGLGGACLPTTHFVLSGLDSEECRAYIQGPLRPKRCGELCIPLGHGAVVPWFCY